MQALGFPGGASAKGSFCQCRKLRKQGFDPWVKKVPWRMKWQPNPVLLLWKFPSAWWATVHELQSIKCNWVCACTCTHMHQVLCQRLGAEGLTEEDVVSPWLELSFCHCLRKVLSWWSFLHVNFHYYSMNGSSFLEWLILMRSAGIPSTYNHTAWMECF